MEPNVYVSVLRQMMEWAGIIKWKPGLFHDLIERVTFEHYRVPDHMISHLIEGHCEIKGKPEGLLFHYRKGFDQWEPAKYGGKTICHLTLKDGTCLDGVSMCSLSDKFIYKEGRDRSFTRAVEKMIG